MSAAGNVNNNCTSKWISSSSSHSALLMPLRGLLYRLMTVLEVRCGLRLILGIPQFPSPYLCPDCGLEGDEMGIHAMTCRRSGDISRGHTLLRDTALQLSKVCLAIPGAAQQTYL